MPTKPSQLVELMTSQLDLLQSILRPPPQTCLKRPLHKVPLDSSGTPSIPVNSGTLLSSRLDSNGVITLPTTMVMILNSNRGTTMPLRLRLEITSLSLSLSGRAQMRLGIVAQCVMPIQPDPPTGLEDLLKEERSRARNDMLSEVVQLMVTVDGTPPTAPSVPEKLGPTLATELNVDIEEMPVPRL
eukprot:sb/3471375/